MKKFAVLSLLAVMVTFTSQAHAGLELIKDCGSSTSDIREITNYVDNNWRDFEDFIEDETGLNIKNCMENRFQKNGKVVCESKMTGNCKGANGWASYLSHKAHICPDFLDRVRAFTSENNRKACYLALIAHEFGHTCWRGHGTVEDIDDAAFKYAKERFGATISHASCAMD